MIMEKRNDFSVFELKETCGRGAAGNYNGNAVLYTPAAGGIYQIEVLVAADCGGDVRYYVWDEDEDREIGFAAKGDMKAFGVCDEQWQIDLRNCAKSFLGSTDYLEMSEISAQYGFSEYPGKDGAYKCNLFVAHRAVQSAVPVPAIHGRLWHAYPPLANEWGDRSFGIEGWSCVDVAGFPQAGFVSSDPATGGTPGHMGIVDFDGMGISAGMLNVNRNFNACNQDTVLRKYVGGGEE